MGKRGNLPPRPVRSVLADKQLISPSSGGPALWRAQPPRAPCPLHPSSVIPVPFGDLAGRHGEMPRRPAQDAIGEWPDPSGCAGETTQVNEVRR